MNSISKKIKFIFEFDHPPKNSLCIFVIFLWYEECSEMEDTIVILTLQALIYDPKVWNVSAIFLIKIN